MPPPVLRWRHGSDVLRTCYASDRYHYVARKNNTDSESAKPIDPQ